MREREEERDREREREGERENEGESGVGEKTFSLLRDAQSRILGF